MESYRRLCLRLGAAMLCHFVLINAVMVTVLSLVDALSYDLDYRTYNLIYQLLYAALYLASFMLPVAFFRVLDHDEPPQPMGMAPTLTWRTVPMIFAVLGVNLPCAYLNSLFMELLESMGIENLLNYAESEIYYPEDYVLLHLTLALVPAFCEEFLFRGLICGRLLPYGKTVAIVGSAVLFGLMHGNLGQLFYTTMAGIMLGWCYAETRSIWPGVLAHMLNNLTGFLSEYWYSALPTGRAWVYDNLLSAAILFAGLGSVVWLLAARRKDVDTPVLGLGNTRPLPDRPAARIPAHVSLCAGIFPPDNGDLFCGFARQHSCCFGDRTAPWHFQHLGCAGMTNDEKWMRLALDEARLAAGKGEVPVGAVLVRGDNLLVCAHNLRETNRSATAHAELLAIESGCAVLGGWRLQGCTLYVTLEPCPMCAGAILNARLSRLVYAAKDPRAGAFGSLLNLNAYPLNHRVAVTAGVCADEALALLRGFFAERR